MNWILAALLLTLPDEQAAKKVHAHLLIEDVHSAVKTAKSYLELYPESKALHSALIRALAQSGNELETLEQWDVALSKYQDLLQDRATLEGMAWGVLKKGSGSQQLLIQLFALIGAAITKDARAVPLLIEQLRGSNSLLRSVAVGLAAEYGDIPLRDEIRRLLKEDRVWSVRLEAIKAVGKLRMEDQKERLIEIIGHPKTLAEEKAAAIVSLVSLYEGIEEKELKMLLSSPRAGLRELGCQIIAHLDLKEYAELAAPLLNDAHPAVRISALNLHVLLDLPLPPRIDKLLMDHAPEVAITAGWATLVKGDPRGSQSLRRWLLNNESRWRRLASAAIAASGSQGVALAREMLEKTGDPFVVVNLSIGLIGQRQSVQRATEALDTALRQEDGALWMWETAYNPLFRSLAPSTVSHQPQVPDYPHAVDQLTRLELLSLLCMLQYPHALEAVKGFLQHQNWGATGAAAVTLVREGDEESLRVVRQLLKDPDEHVQIQAALILCMIGGDPEAIQTLQSAYPKVERELKIRILEALAQVGDPSSIPFLLGILNEPFQALRVIAASAIIQCLSN